MNNGADKWAKERYIIKVTAVFFVMAHLYCYVNTMYSHDSLMVYQADDGWQISLGRFLQPLYWKLRGRITAPFLMGLLSFLWLVLAVILVVKILEIKGKIETALVCGVLSTSIAVTLLNASFVHQTDNYMLAFLFSVLCVWVTVSFRFGFLPGAVFMALSMGLYQSYFQAAVILFMIYYVKKILETNDSRKVLLGGIKSVVSLLLGGGLYYVMFQLALRITGITASSGYNGITGVGKYEGVSLVSLVKDTYAFVLEQFLNPETYNRGLVAWLNILLLVLICIGLVEIAYKKKLAVYNGVLLAALVVLMPFGMNVVYFISKGMEHSLMIHSFSFAYVFAIVIWEMLIQDLETRKHIVRVAASWIVPVLVGVVIFNHIIFSNQLYLEKELQYQATLSTVTRLIDRMEQTEGYQPGETQVVLLGNLNDSSLAMERNGFAEICGIGAYSNFGTTYDSAYHWYFGYILGYPIQIADGSLAAEYTQRQDVQEMGAFPATDCCKMIEDVLVVKLSD